VGKPGKLGPEKNLPNQRDDQDGDTTQTMSRLLLANRRKFLRAAEFPAQAKRIDEKALTI
jgi:hypothetical protein